MAIKLSRLELTDDAIKGYAIIECVEIEMVTIPIHNSLYGMKNINISPEALLDFVDIINCSIEK